MRQVLHLQGNLLPGREDRGLVQAPGRLRRVEVLGEGGPEGAVHAVDLRAGPVTAPERVREDQHLPVLEAVPDLLEPVGDHGPVELDVGRGARALGAVVIPGIEQDPVPLAGVELAELGQVHQDVPGILGLPVAHAPVEKTRRALPPGAPLQQAGLPADPRVHVVAHEGGEVRVAGVEPELPPGLEELGVLLRRRPGPLGPPGVPEHGGHGAPDVHDRVEGLLPGTRDQDVALPEVRLRVEQRGVVVDLVVGLPVPREPRLVGRVEPGLVEPALLLEVLGHDLRGLGIRGLGEPHHPVPRPERADVEPGQGPAVGVVGSVQARRHVRVVFGEIHGEERALRVHLEGEGALVGGEVHPVPVQLPLVVPLDADLRLAAEPLGAAVVVGAQVEAHPVGGAHVALHGEVEIPDGEGQGQGREGLVARGDGHGPRVVPRDRVRGDVEIDEDRLEIVRGHVEGRRDGGVGVVVGIHEGHQRVGVPARGTQVGQGVGRAVGVEAVDVAGGREVDVDVVLEIALRRGRGDHRAVGAREVGDRQVDPRQAGAVRPDHHLEALVLVLRRGQAHRVRAPGEGPVLEDLGRGRRRGDVDRGGRGRGDEEADDHDDEMSHAPPVLGSVSKCGRGVPPRIGPGRASHERRYGPEGPLTTDRDGESPLVCWQGATMRRGGVMSKRSNAASGHAGFVQGREFTCSVL